MLDSSRRTAQVCEKGHLITDSVEDFPQDLEDFCSTCGAKTLTACPNCNAPIPGATHDESSIHMDFPIFSAPAYCICCGKPYPWTQAALDTAKELILEDSDMPESDQTKLIEVLPDIISETPKTNLAAVRFRKALCAAGKFTAEGLRQFVIDFGCELAKKQLGI